ncbi:MAG: biotin carboxylase [Paraglaciecola sp.]|jgi:biotin carboxylase
MDTKNRKTAGIIHAYPSDYLLDSLAAAGWQVALICPQELEGAAILQHPALVDVRLCDFEQSAAVVNTAQVSNRFVQWDIVLPVNEGCVDLSAMVCERLNLTGNSVFAATNSRDKDKSYQQFANAAIAHPSSTVVNSYSQAMDIVPQMAYPSILKLADSMNSQGVIRVNDDSQYQTGMAHLFSLFDANKNTDFAQDRNIYAYGKAGKKVLIQPFLSDEEVGIDLLYKHGEIAILGIFEKSPSNGPYFAEKYSVYPTSLNPTKLDHALKLAKTSLLALDVSVGAAHVEIRFANDTPYVLEIGLRPGGGYTAIACEQLSGINIYAALADLLMGGALPKPQIADNLAVLYGGVAYEQSGTLTHINGIEAITEQPGLVDHVFLAKVGDLVYTMPHAAQPHFAYYLLNGSTRQGLLEAYGNIESQVRLTIAVPHSAPEKL